MPARPPLVADPPSIVVQGDQLLSSVLPTLGLPVPLLAGEQPPLPTAIWPLVIENRVVASIVTEPMPTPYRTLAGGEMRAANAGISTTTGEWLPLSSWRTPVLNPFTQASVLFAFVGTTRDSGGSALGNCRVIAFETGRLVNDNIQAEVGETISDGSGAYTLPVPLNTAYQLTAYKAGSPDVAGISANTVTPTAIG